MLNVKDLREKYLDAPDMNDPSKKVSFGTSGHRGSPLNGTFNEAHILAITQAVVDYRNGQNISEPLFVGMDSHASSLPAIKTALEVLAANDVDVLIEESLSFDDKGGYTPTPSVSFAIIEHNKNGGPLSDGIIITPSHNPPQDGGIKYNPPSGGAADTSVTKAIEDLANKYLLTGNQDVKRIFFESALKKVKRHDYITPYVKALKDIIDMDLIRDSKIKIGADPLGGAALEYLEPIKAEYGIDLTVINKEFDLTFSFMPKDHDGKIRMDCSSPYAMANVIKDKDKYDIIFSNDTDSDRHGIVTKSGLMNPNHFLSCAIFYLIQHRPSWPKNAMIGKTLVSSSMIDRVAEHLKKKVLETPVGFKYFVEPLSNASICFGGEESAGASFLRKDGTVWTTDKDGIIMGLLAAEICARLKKDPSVLYKELTDMFGTSYYQRIDTPADTKTRTKLKDIKETDIKISALAGEKIISIQTKAGNGEPIGGIKVSTKNGWFAARPSGTEDIAKLYCESFVSAEHLRQIQLEAKELMSKI